jgi:zinc protease
VPERTIVAIVGAVEPERALDMARAAYRGWTPAPGANDPSPGEPPRRDVRARTLRGDVSQAELAVGWRTVAPLHPDAAALDVAAAVLAAGRGSWLQRALRETGIVTSIAAYNYSPTELGVFGITADLDAERVPAAIEGIAQATARLGLAGPAAADLDRAKTLLLTRWARRLESMEGRAAALASAEALADVGVLDREYAALAAASADDVRTVAARYLDPEAVSAVAYLPRDAGAELTADHLAQTFAVTAFPPTPTPAGSAPSPAGRRTVRGTVESDVFHAALPGADLLIRRKQGVPTVTLGLYVPRLEFDPPGQAGLGALTVRSGLRGAGGLDAGGLAFAAERLGGTLGAGLTSDWVGVGLTALAERLADAAALINAVHRTPTLADGAVAAERDLLVAEARQVADDMFRYPFQLAFAEAFGDAGYGLPVAGLPETLADLAGSDARQWHTQTLLAARPVIVAVGDVAPESAAEVLAGVFESLPARADGPALSPLKWALDSRLLERVVCRDKAQTALAMVFRGPDRRSPERFAAEVWAAVASGLGGRIFEALRDRRSLAYTVLASSWQKGRAGALVSYIATSPDREAEARAAMLEELQRFVREPVTATELTQAVNYLSGQAEVRRQHATSVAGEVLEAWLVGDGLQELADPGAAYRRVSIEEVQALAAARLAGLARAEGVVRGTGGGK